METEARILRSSSTRAIVGMDNTPVSQRSRPEPGARSARRTAVQPVCAQNVAATLIDSQARGQFIKPGAGLGVDAAVLLVASSEARIANGEPGSGLAASHPFAIRYSPLESC